jgi:SMI1/KNR4 family protein SUKH-1
MSIRLEDTGPPADETALSDLEDRTGRPLPVAYRDFLEAHDGAIPEPNTLPDAAGSQEVTVRRFFSVEEIVRRIEELGPDRLPEEVVPIADDDEGNGLFLHLEDGSVWSWVPDEEDPSEEDLWAALTKEAEDLDELLDRLEPTGDAESDDEPDLLDEGYSDAEFRERGGDGDAFDE